MTGITRLVALWLGVASQCTMQDLTPEFMTPEFHILIMNDCAEIYRLILWWKQASPSGSFHIGRDSPWNSVQNVLHIFKKLHRIQIKLS